MANLSAYINFNATLLKDLTSSTLILSDPDYYPPGIDVDLLGYFVITQPDTITITGNYITPDIYWNGTQLAQANKELRLTALGGFEQGSYTITYHIVAPGYDETTLTRSFNLAYTNPTLDVTQNFDVFTPQLSLTDSSTYTQSGMSLVYMQRSWSAAIITVEGTPHVINSYNQTFDLNYLGSYYDSQYDASLLVNLIYLVGSPDDWVQINDTYLFRHTYAAFIPPTIIQLLALLTSYKASLDASNCICGPGCACNCSTLISTYTLAVSIYTHIIERGRNDQITGLSDYVLQLQKLLNNCVTPVYTNTNNAIPPYDWGNTPVGTLFNFYKQMIVGSGVNNAPPNGATTYTDTNLIGKSVIVYLDSLLMGNGLNDRVSITYNSTTGTITWNAPLNSPQLITIYTYT